MGTTCLAACAECQRHVRCGERTCPFCGAKLAVVLRVLEYRLKTRLDRGSLFSLGAALSAAGIISGCDAGGAPIYGISCTTPGACRPVPTGQGGNLGGVGGAEAGNSAVPSGGLILNGGAATSGAAVGGAAGSGGGSPAGGDGNFAAGAGGVAGDGGSYAAGAGGTPGEGGAADGGSPAGGAGNGGALP